MIIGIALVVDELNKGQRLVFRYPDHIPKDPFIRLNDELYRLHKEYLSIRLILLFCFFVIFLFRPDSFAKLFRPKAAMCNKVLELVIDDLHFYSFPSPCVEDSSNAQNSGNSSQNEVPKFLSNPNLSSNQNTGAASGVYRDIISLFNVVIVTIKRTAMFKVLKAHLMNMQSKINSVTNSFIASSVTSSYGHMANMPLNGEFSSKYSSAAVLMHELHRRSSEVVQETKVLEWYEKIKHSNSKAVSILDIESDLLGVSGYDPLVILLDSLYPPEFESACARDHILSRFDGFSDDIAEDIDLYAAHYCSGGFVQRYCGLSEATIRR